MIESTASSSLEKVYASGLLQKMKHTGYVPDPILEAVINYMMYGSDGLDRSVFCPAGQCDIPISLSQIWGYGCWCNFGADVGVGSGTPTDKFDEKCRDFQKCMRCVQNDAEDGGYSSWEF